MLHYLLYAFIETVNATPWRKRLNRRTDTLSLPIRHPPMNTSIPIITLFLPIPELSLNWAALISAMFLSLDQLHDSKYPNFWVNLNVSLISNSMDALTKSEDAVIKEGAVGFLGDAMYTEIVNIADKHTVPICEPLGTCCFLRTCLKLRPTEDTRSALSNHAQYPMFFRMVPTIQNEIDAIFTLAVYNLWSSVSIITSSDFAGPCFDIYLWLVLSQGFQIQLLFLHRLQRRV
ncbi:hypothetical protein BC830DRAFT_761370 [Chytriomyces sp. MP71]|nr:hypothetical protein BC830DRAFT_761370 [Chytriomyces sp. MP71]